MPIVGNKKFPYTPEGEGQAETYAAQTGQAVTREEGNGQNKDQFGYGTYQEGGEVLEHKTNLDTKYQEDMSKLMEFLQPLMERRAMSGKYKDQNALYFQALGDVIDENLEDKIEELGLGEIWSKEFNRMLENV